MKQHIKAVTQLYSSKLQSLLNCLEHVSRRGDNYRARCPAHGGKSRSTLSITEKDDGRILLHCFHGCSVEEVLDRPVALYLPM